LALSVAHAAPIDREAVVLEGLMEQRFGVIENMTWEEAEAALGKDVLAGWFTSPVDYAPPEAESIRQVYDRVTRVMEEILPRHGQEDNILIVAHGALLRCLTVSLLGLEPEAANRVFFNNCMVCRVDLLEGFGQLRMLI
jgi:broad specificity phosphatase PhoE